MNKYRALWAIALGGALVIGCSDKKDEKPAAPSTPTTPTTPPPPVPQSNSGAPAATLPTVPNTAAVPGLPPVPATAPAVTEVASADAQKLLLQAKEDIAAKKWDAADADLKKLEGIKDQLSTQLQVTVTSLRTQLDASKAAGSIKIPGFGDDSKNK
jgi:hypothetical protein